MISRRQNLQPNRQTYLSPKHLVHTIKQEEEEFRKRRSKRMKHEVMNIIKPRSITIFFLLFALLLGDYVIQASRAPSIEDTGSFPEQVHLQKPRRRQMIGSTAPTCTYNECRGCRYRCRAEQVPVEGNDPINSAYHYRCVCHR